MPVSDDRFSRDLRRYNLALRMLRLAARPNTIRAWTGLSRQRVRSLLRAYRYAAAQPVAGVLRGPSPTRFASLLADANLRRELTAMAGWCRILGVIPPEAVSNARHRLPNVATGERLCRALETFRSVVPHTRLTLEQLVLLVFALAEGQEWHLDHCIHCRAVILIDRLSVAGRVCMDCREEASEREGRAVPPVSASSASVNTFGSPEAQQRLL